MSEVVVTLLIPIHILLILELALYVVAAFILVRLSADNKSRRGWQVYLLLGALAITLFVLPRDYDPPVEMMKLAADLIWKGGLLVMAALWLIAGFVVWLPTMFLIRYVRANADRLS